MRRFLFGIFVFSLSGYAETNLERMLGGYIEEQPAHVLTCYVQAFVMPTGKPDPRNQIIIATEMLEKGFQTQRIQPYGRVREGSYYVFGTITKTFLSAPLDMRHEKLEAVRTARKVFLTGMNYHTIDDSIRLQGCSMTQLQ